MDCLSYFYYIMYERYKIFYKHSVFRSEALNSATNYAYFRAHLLHRRYLLFFSYRQFVSSFIPNF